MTGYEAAIRYLELGWQPLPIQPRGKRPHFELLEKAVYDTNKTAQLGAGHGQAWGPGPSPSESEDRDPDRTRRHGDRP